MNDSFDKQNIQSQIMAEDCLIVLKGEHSI